MLTMTLLSLLQDITLRLLVCLAILSLPSLLIIWTAKVICRRGSFKNTKALFLLNLALSAGIATLIITTGVETFYEVAEFSYRLTLATGIIAAMFVLYFLMKQNYFPERQAYQNE